MTQRIVLLAALALASVASAAGYYLPGTYPQEFVVGQQLQGKSARQACKNSWLDGAFRCHHSRSDTTACLTCVRLGTLDMHTKFR